jgi:hypothetical protein
MILNQHLREADESIEIIHNSQGQSVCFYIKDGEAIMFPTIDDLVRYVYLGEGTKREYLLESELDGIYQTDLYDYHQIKEYLNKKRTNLTRSKKYEVSWIRTHKVTTIVDCAGSTEEAIRLGMCASEEQLDIQHVDSSDFEASVIDDTDTKKF